MNPWKNLIAIFRDISDEKPPTYLLELDRVCARFALVLSFMSLIIWLRYISIDREIFPDIPWMIYVRYGLIGIGFINIALFLFVRFSYQGLILMSILAFYYINGAAILAGVTQGRSIYFAGYIVAILVVLFTPLPKSINYFVTYSSLLSFGSFAYLSHFDIKNTENAFMVSLCINVIILSSVFIFILDRSRRRSYQKSKEIENRIREIEYQKQEIQTLSDFSKTLNEEQDINRVLDQVFQFIRNTYNIDYIWLNEIAADKKMIRSYKFVSRVKLPVESAEFMNRFQAPLQPESGTFYLTYHRKSSFYMNRNIEKFLNSKVDKDITHALQLESFFIVPLLIQGEVIALACFTNYKSSLNLSRKQRNELERFCQQIAGALNTAKILSELSESIENLKESQAQLIQSEKMAGLGQIVASVAHEINTPLGAIKASAENLSLSWKKFSKSVQGSFVESISQRSPQLKNQIQSAISHTIEGTLSTREHRIKKKELESFLQTRGFPENRLESLAQKLVDSGIYNLSDDMLKVVESESGDQVLDFLSLVHSIESQQNNILTAADRTTKIVTALKTFSHRENSGHKTLYNIHEGINTILTIYSSLLKQGVHVETQLDSLPSFPAYADELNQVWTNLLHNSIQAMKNKGLIRIQGRVLDSDSKKYLEVLFEDDGPGISSEYQKKIFQPFFTTKIAGEGSGLGLHITKQILDKHDGEIELTSRPGKTVFRVTLPIDNGLPV